MMLATAITAIATPSAGGATPATTTFSYTAAAQSYTVPSGVTEITIDAFGAQGGRGATVAYDPGNPNVDGSVVTADGGLGGWARTTIAVTPGEQLQINVGGAGGDGLARENSEGQPVVAFGAAGFNGGGVGSALLDADQFQGCGSAGGGGGGAYTLADRVVVAAGGGGGGGYGEFTGAGFLRQGASRGGAGGGVGGETGQPNPANLFPGTGALPFVGGLVGGAAGTGGAAIAFKSARQ